jgi:caa(3)-type oxidase subunit IV
MTSNAHTHPPYIRIWLILLAALAGSLVLGIWAGSKVMIAIIFAVAIVKAFLVVSYYMHMKFAPRWLRLVAVSAVVVVAICYFGLLPDIQWGYATLSADEMETIANGANATASSGEDTETGASAAGAAVYKTYCVACHQADGRGMGGMLAADFIGDPTRLAKSDEQLLTSIRDGVTGKIGVMPPWGSALSETQQREALSYVRSQFGSTK